MEQRHALSFTFTSPQIRMEKGREQESESRSQGKGCVASVSPNLISNGSSQYTDGVPIHSFFDAEKAKERQTGERRFRPITSLLFFNPAHIDVVSS